MRTNENPLENQLTQEQQAQPVDLPDSASNTVNPENITPQTENQMFSQEKRKISSAERLLLPVALAIAILFDRLMCAPFFDWSDNMPIFSGVFWLCYLVAFYAFYWKKLMQNRVLWIVAGFSAALCAWNFFFAGNEEFSALTFLVIPWVLMAHAQYAAGDYGLKDAGKIALAWLTGWFVKPFSGLPVFFGAVGSLGAGSGNSTAKKVAIGAGITLPLLCVIVPLLASADMVFGFYIGQIAGGFDIGSFVAHIVIAAIAFALFYSFLWNVGFGSKSKLAKETAFQIDAVICSIVLGSITLLYVLFCAVQFTYLFAGAGLPDGMTYSEYAREGFAQTVVVCAMNLLIFGIFLRFGSKHKAVTGFLAGLLGLTGLMLFSGFMRLRLYIDAYGLTWLRLLSAWFIIYLAVVIILCAIRMFKEKLPAIALCALILLGWYTMLGYSNPDAVVSRYNQSHNHDAVETWR